MTQGWIRYVACSTHPPWRTVEALHIAEKYGYPKFICEQPPYNLLDRRVENEIVPMCRQYDLGMMTWSPLAQGVLAGRYQNAQDIPDDSRGAQKPIFAERITGEGIAAARRMNELALKKQTPLPALAVSWVLHQPGVSSVIIGPRTADHLAMLIPSVDLKLHSGDLEYCDSIVPPGSYVSNHFNTAGWQVP